MPGYVWKKRYADDQLIQKKTAYCYYHCILVPALLYYHCAHILVPFFNEAASTLHPNILALLGFGALMTKAVIFILIFMWVRWTIPRFRYDQLMGLGWKGLLPLALLNMVITAAVVLFLNSK